MEGREEKNKPIRDLISFPIIFNVIGFSSIGLLFIASPESLTDPSTFNLVIYLSVFLTEWLLAFTIIRRLRKQGFSIKEVITPKKEFKPIPAILVFVSLNALFPTYIILSLMLNRIPYMYGLTLLEVVFFIIVSPITAGFVEELIWRGYFIEKLLARGDSKWRAILLSSISFAFIHGFFLIDKLIVTFLFGIIAGLYYFQERHLPVLILSHVTVDVIAFALAIVI